VESNLRWLYAGRALRSFTTAVLTIVFPLYLAQAGYRSPEIGAVLTAGSALTTALVAAVGLAGDRWGRRRVLLVLAALGAVGAAALAVSANPVVALLASGLGGVGRGGGAGSGGSWGPVFPAEQPLLAGSVAPRDRTRAFGTIAFVGVLAGAAGSLGASAPATLHAAGWSWLAAYRLVFWASALLAVGMVLATVPLREVRPQPEEAAGGRAPLSTGQLLRRLAVTNGLNGLGVGFLGPLLTYWFHVRFGVGPARIGVLYTVVNLVTALPYLGAARLAARLGAVRAVTATRALSVALLPVMAAMPTFPLAGVAFALRMAANSLSLPTRQSYVMGVAEERHRGLVAALGSLPSQVTQSISPIVGGWAMQFDVDAPLYGAALFMAANLVAFYLAFRHTPPPEEARPAEAPSEVATRV
jgi:MFS family permease